MATPSATATVEAAVIPTETNTPANSPVPTATKQATPLPPPTATLIEETAVASQEITSTLPMTDTSTSLLPTNVAPTPEAVDNNQASATPARLPVTGAGNANRGLAIMLTVTAVLTLLIGLSLWEKKGVAA